MGIHKLVLDTIEEDDYGLIAIHCSLPSYKLAFLINKYADLRLSRNKSDIYFEYDSLSANFPLFQYNDYFKYNTYNLIGNKFFSKTIVNNTEQNSLFTSDIEEISIIKHLIPELKNVDYFLKIDSESYMLSERSILKKLNTVKQIITAYSIDYTQLKSKNNLILQ